MDTLRHVLQGMPDLEFPLGLETYERTVRHETNTPADAPLPGFAKTVHAFRPTFVGSGYVEDEGDIPTGKKFVQKKPCCIAHPGVCRKRDEAVYQQLKLAAQTLSSIVCQ